MENISAVQMPELFKYVCRVKKEKGQKQHYVQKSYLKNFTNNDGVFYQIKVKEAPFQVSPKEFTVAGVCYSHDFYTVNEESLKSALGITGNPSFLETHGFLYENSLPKILDKIKAKDRWIFRREMDLIIDAYLNFKQRNLYTRNLINNKEWTTKSIDKVIEETGKQINETLLLEYGHDYRKIAAQTKERILNNPLHGKQMQLDILLASLRRQNQPLVDSRLNFALAKVIICEAGDSDYFIVSDNPGYTLKEFNGVTNVCNTDFSGWQEIAFPLNSKQLMLFILRLPDYRNLIKPFRELVYEKTIIRTNTYIE